MQQTYVTAVAMDIFSSERFSACGNVLAVVGVLFLLKITVNLLWHLGGGFRAYFLAPCLGVGRIDLKKFGPWGAVTGASEGIGKGYALELAKQGLNVVLMSRSQEKLEKVAAEIRDKYSRETLIIPVDFSEGLAIYPRLGDQLRGLEIGVLVNNVGLSHKYAQYFLEAGEKRLRDIIELNCQAMIQMTHLLLPAMVARGRGAVINISSFVSNHPIPLLSIYAATKIFVNYFSTSLSKEYASKGIRVQTVTPNFVSTAMTKMHRNVFVPSAAKYVKSAISTIGIEEMTSGYLPHAIAHTVIHVIPKSIVGRMEFAVLSYARSRYLKITAQRKYNAKKRE